MATEIETYQKAWDEFLDSYQALQTKYNRLEEFAQKLCTEENTKEFYAITGKVIDKDGKG